MQTLFWLSIGLILYVYLGYPAVVYLVSLLYRKHTVNSYCYPFVSVVLAVYNEETNIENKIKSLLNLYYPSDKIEILIGSDGSTDNTDALIEKHLSPKLKFCRQAERRGKPSILNKLVSMAQGEVLLFTDARQNLDELALIEIARNFSDDKVGSVSAQLVFEKGANKASSGVGLYWSYEKFIRAAESKTGSMLGATGALYAIRRILFPRLPKNLILDDVYIPMKVIQKGYRAIFEPKAKVYDRVSDDTNKEFLRKVRTLAGNLQLFFYLKDFLNPFKSLVGWQFLSHKFMRLLIPFFLVFVLVSNLFILTSDFYRWVLTAQIVFYVFAALGAVFKHVNYLFDVPYMFCVLNAAGVVGIYKFITKKQGVLWEKTGV